jgi:hypothetical protein
MRQTRSWMLKVLRGGPFLGAATGKNKPPFMRKNMQALFRVSRLSM